MRKSIAFVVAPYGFGPSSKAVAISSYLPRSIERVFLSEGPQLEMARSSNEFSSCARLDFSADGERVNERLSSFDVLIFINSTRFISASARAGRPTILVETLAWLRKEPPPCSSLLSGYFAQRFFDHAFSPELNAMNNFHAVGAIVPKSISRVATRDCAVFSSHRSPIVHCGGLFSPAMIEGAGSEFMAQTLNAVRKLNEPVRAVLPSYMHSRFRAEVDQTISLVDCSPLSVHEHILGSEFSITTTGIEFTYETMLLGVPAIFLPPFNASQFFQLDYHRKACVDCVPFRVEAGRRQSAFSLLQETTAHLQQAGMAGLWRTQFAEVSQFLHRFIPNGRAPVLRRIQENQQKAIERIGTDGAQTIASHVWREIGLEVAL